MPLLDTLLFSTNLVTVTNVWNSAYFPISGQTVFNNTGSPYTVQSIITNGVFDHVKYAAYSPVFLLTIFALVYGTLFAAFPSIVMHMFRKFLLCCMLNNFYHKF